MVETIEIAGRKIGTNQPCFIIAEAGVNHNGELRRAMELIDAASRAGADAVKFQTFAADRLVTREAPKADYQKLTTDAVESQYEMVRRLQLSSEAHLELMNYCRERGVLFLSTPFDEESADMLEELGVPAYKISSGEITNLGFVSYLAQKKKPLIISTGMSNLGEVESAVLAVRSVGNNEFVLLHCVSSYPADPVDVNLRAMHTMKKVFQVPVGYSDHTTGIEVAQAAVALGACVIEKHLTLDRHLPGPDHQASLEPKEFASMVQGIRVIEAALGSGRKEPASSEANTAAVARKSLVAARDIAAGTALTEEMIAIMRPGTGLPPAMRLQLLGRVVSTDIPAGTLLGLEMLT